MSDDKHSINALDAYDEAAILSSQLSALTIVATGEEFLTWNDTIKTNYLWAVSQMTDRIGELLPHIWQGRRPT